MDTKFLRARAALAALIGRKNIISILRYGVHAGSTQDCRSTLISDQRSNSLGVDYSDVDQVPYDAG